MDNVYDYINDFYTNDDGWNMVIPRDDVETYLRKCAWQGMDDKALQKEWDNLSIFCIYLENDMLEMQDVTEEILVGCVIWACRYIVEFMGTYDAIKAFLDTLERFFVLMKERGVLMSVLAPHLAAKTLLNEDGTVAIVTCHGQLQKGEEEWETWVGPPPEGNIFLHAGVGLEEIMGEINMFFQTSRFTPDLDRAMRLYRHAEGRLDLEGPEETDFWKGFWDYFLFNYRTMDTADTPISFFAEHSGTHYETLAYELSRARLRLFVLGEVLDETRCLAEDLMTGDHFYVNMTPEMASHHDLGDVILGNIFQNQSLCMNYEKSFRLSPLSRNKLHTILQQCLDWFLIQGPDLTWSDFMAANPLFVRRIVSLVSNNPAAVAFPYKTAIKDYKPPRMTPALDRSEQAVKEIMAAAGFGITEFYFARRLWHDFLKTDPNLSALGPERWAAGIFENFLEINEKRAAQKKPFFSESLGLPQHHIAEAYQTIRSALSLEPSDPRYLTEVGYMMMFSNLSEEETMICSHCGLEYPDHLAECPNCHTPNDDIAAEVLTEDERDAFEGVTIDQVPDSDTYRVMDQDDLKQAQEEAKPFRLRVLNFLLGHLGLVAVGIIVFLVLLIPVFLSLMLPFVGYFIIIAAIFLSCG